MESLLNKLAEKSVWQEFYQYKSERNHLSWKELRELESFIAEEKYRAVAGNMTFSVPQKKILSKIGTDKKRTVYCYGPEETWVLKLLAWLLYKYDPLLSDNCYSFRRFIAPKTAFDRIRRIPDRDSCMVLKLDIRDYFNSIDPQQLVGVLSEVLADDPKLLSFLRSLLLQKKCVYRGQEIEEKRGAMAGVPLSSFFANFYLRDLDLYFENKGIPYFRYSDDILLFLRNETELEKYYAHIREHLKAKGLELNPGKYSLSLPGENWDFLGFSCRSGETDLAKITVDKMKGRIRRKARKLWRERSSRNLPFETVAKAMIRSFDYKIYDLSGTNEFTWSRFYFPLITRTEGLHEIDRYMQQYLRYLESGRNYKGNYRIRYGKLKKLGYTPLVSEYYNWKEENERLRRQFSAD